MNNNTTILFVDDEELNRKLFHYTFQYKFLIETAENANEALEKLEKNSRIKGVITDLNMPGLNGLDFIKIAKPIYPDITFFILSGYLINRDIQDAIDSGLIKEYMTKPFNVQEIESSLLNLVDYPAQKV